MKKKWLFPMKLQFFAEGDSTIDDMSSLENFLAGMDGNNEGTDGAEEELEQDQTQEDAQGTSQQEKPKDNPPAQQKQDKANQQEYTFAQMRVQNAQLKSMLGKIAKAYGIEYANDEDLLAKLNEDAITKLAQRQNVPPELLKRMEMLEQHSMLYQQEQLKQQAFIGFQRVKDQFNLSEEELRAFAAELDEKGKNPFLQQVDLITEYKVLHFDDIIEKKAREAVEAALKKSNAADKHGSTPSSKNGKPDNGNVEKITTIAQLDEFLKNVK